MHIKWGLGFIITSNIANQVLLKKNKILIVVHAANTGDMAMATEYPFSILQSTEIYWFWAENIICRNEMLCAHCLILDVSST